MSDIASLVTKMEKHNSIFENSIRSLEVPVCAAFKDGGSIILNSSVSNVLGLPGFSAYATSKAAVRNLARTWA